MIANFDWCLKFTANDHYRCDARHPLWNIDVAVRHDGTKVPLISDFDLSGMVTGTHPWFADVFTVDFVASKSAAEVEVIAQVQRARSLFTRDRLNETRAHFLRRKANAYRALEEAGLDPAGKRNVKDYLDGFFKFIDADVEFYLPVVARPNVRPFSDPGRRRPVCGGQDTVPIGTPVTTPLRVAGAMAEVRLLDALWHWAPPVDCKRVRRGPIWIDRAAIDSHYP
jgi:hypothetical protein